MDVQSCQEHVTSALGLGWFEGGIGKRGLISENAPPPVYFYKGDLICLTFKTSQTVAWRESCPHGVRKKHDS